MRASLVIPTLNAAKELPALLETVQAQTVELEEVLVVDSSSKDGTSDVAKRFGCVLSSSRRQNRRYDFDTFSVLRADRLSYF